MVTEYINKINETLDLPTLEQIRIEVFGKKGWLTADFAKLKEVSNEEKAILAKTLNQTKESLTKALEERKKFLEERALEEKLLKEKIDPTLLSYLSSAGAYHPIRETMDKITEFFLAMNFSLETGPIIENDFNNFEVLNLPSHHPARDMQDTFYLNSGLLLRTHTSSVQARVMSTRKPPIRMIAPGAVCRRDFDLTHTPMFHQVEGLVVDEVGKVSFANLKFMLTQFLEHMFGDIKVRFRPSFFPFTEPSSEVDISCVFCGGDGCRVCKNTGWLEVLGCGVVDPNVFKAVGYENVSGYAFGMGVERFVMLLHRVSDMRLLYEGDLRLLEQFK